MSRLHLGQHHAAIPDLAKLCSSRQDWPHCALWLFIARKRSGAPHPNAATQLRQTKNRPRAGTWPEPIFRFYLGELSAKQLERAAKNPNQVKQREQECEGFYYLGQHALISGNTAQARRYFKLSVATKVTTFIEHSGAQAELKRLSP